MAMMMMMILIENCAAERARDWMIATTTLTFSFFKKRNVADACLQGCEK
jgi:hypothetical protein